MKISSITRTEKQEVKMMGASKVYKQMPLTRKNGVPLYSFRVFIIDSGGYTPNHHYPYEHMNFIISEKSALVNEKKEGYSVKKKIL